MTAQPFVPRRPRNDLGKRRIHQTPDRIEIVACRPWLVAEFALTHPELVVVLGATVHPSSVLRADNRDVAYGSFVNDLKVAAHALA